MIYQPRNVQPSGVSIDGLLNNTFTMEIQTNSYVSAYQLLIVDFDNNEIYTGSKTTLANYAYNGDILEIPVNASTVALSNGANYKWRVRLYQPTADMLITYGLVQATSTTTAIYLQPNINIKAGMAITINGQTKTISSYNSDTGVAVVSNAFSSAPAVGTQYKIYSDFIETVPDYIVYARQTPAVAISNVPSSLTLKYHTFQGTYTQSDNVPIVYHKFDLYTKNDDGTISLVASSDKVYSANLSYTYDSFRTGNEYLIQMTVENDMGVITTTDMYEFNVSYDIVEYLQQPLASFDDKNNAVKVSWVTPVENEATSFRSDAATGIIQDNNNTLTQATFEPGQSIGEGDVIQITNSDCELVIDGKSTQATTTGKNLAEITDVTKTLGSGLNYTAQNGEIKLNGTLSSNLGTSIGTLHLEANTDYYFSINNSASLNDSYLITNDNGTYIYFGVNKTFQVSQTKDYDLTIVLIKGTYNNLILKPQVELGTTKTSWEPYTGGQPSPSPDYPSEIESVGYENLLNPNRPIASSTKAGITVTNNGDGTYTATGTSTNNGAIDLTEINIIKLKKGLPYTNSIEILSGQMQGQIAVTVTNEDETTTYNYINVSSSILSKTVTPNDNKTIKNYQLFWSTSGITMNFTFRVQLEESPVVHPYIPYGKYGIEVKTVGKNLFDCANSRIIYNNGNASYERLTNGLKIISSGSQYNILYFLVDTVENLKGKTLTLSSDISFSKDNQLTSFGLYCTDTNGGNRITLVTNNVASEGKYQVTGQVEEGENRYYVCIGLRPNIASNFASGDYTIYNNLQVEIGETATEYEPYKSNTTLIQLNEPLRSLPNGVKDIAYIKNGILYVDRKVGTVVLNGSETWYMDKELTNTVRFYTSEILTNKAKNAQPILSNYFITATSVNNINNDDNESAYVLNTTQPAIRINKSIANTLTTFKNWLSTHNTQLDYELAEPQIIELGDSAIPYIDGINYMHISSNMDTTFSLVYPHKTISGNTYDYTEFNPPGVKQTGTIKSYNAITGVGTLMAQYPFMYTPMQGDSYAVISNIYNVSGFSYLYNTPYNTVNSLYTHGYTATWATPDGLCVLPDDFNITLQFSPDGNFFYDQNGVYQEVVNLITTETDDANNKGEFTIKIDKNKLIFVQKPDISLELPFYTNTTQVFVLSSASVAQINNDYVWDDTATWTDTYTWVEGGTSLERVCNHWWKVQITNTGIKIEEIFPTT